MNLQEIRSKILAEANVVVCTLSASGSAALGNVSHSFHIVIIDEAAQAQEIETLIPLQYGCRKLILVGDPRQLPATGMDRGRTQLAMAMRASRFAVALLLTSSEQYYRRPPRGSASVAPCSSA